MESSLGTMENDTQVNLLTIRGMEREFLSGQMEEFMKDFGKMASRMAKESSLLLIKK
jgi:hypothetical protein